MSSARISIAVYRLLGWLLLPFFCVFSLFNSRLRATLAERLGLGAWRELNTNPGAVWFHAASVGEVQSLLPVITAFKAQMPAQELVVTTTSDTGRTLAKNLFTNITVLILPYDTQALVGFAFSKIKPRLLVINETEIWPNLLLAAQVHQIPVILINGRISARSFPSYLRVTSLLANLWPAFKAVFVLGQQDKQRFITLGCHEDKIVVSGNSKFDRNLPVLTATERVELCHAVGIDPAAPCVIFGSLRQGEEEIFLEAYISLLHSSPQLVAILAPRHKEQIINYEKIIRNKNLNLHLRSFGDASSQSQVVLLDTIGELTKFYQLADVAVIGGTFVPVGGHNPLEPAFFGVPTVIGPHVSNIQDIVDLFASVGALIQVTSKSELVAQIELILRDQRLSEEVGNKLQQVVRLNTGATKKYLDNISEILKLVSHASGGGEPDRSSSPRRRGSSGNKWYSFPLN